MIEWYKNKKRLNRLFESKDKQRDFQNKMINRGAAISHIETMIRNWDDPKEIEALSKYLRFYGLTPPKTKAECKEMIKDLIECRL